MSRVLVTGGAGFIGSHVVDLLVEEGFDVTVLDSLVEQVHGKHSKRPQYLNQRARLVKGEVGDRGLLRRILNSSDIVIHLASKVGVAQSMYQIERYVDANTRSTAVLLDVLVNESTPVSKVVVASSMSVYGEGKHFCSRCMQAFHPKQRPQETLKEGNWEHLCPTCGQGLSSVPTDEGSPLAPTSIYAMSKRDQEEMSILVGKTCQIPIVALRFFNVYGPRQALSNPYTGVCSIFTNRILNGKPPFLFEDGNQLRDFVNVEDVARACLLALQRKDADYAALNIGTGKPISVLEIARTLAELLGVDLQPQISNKFRNGDIRHCYADISEAGRLLGYKPEIELRAGLAELTEWAKDNGCGSNDMFERAIEELKQKKLTTTRLGR